jgi:hypothetical protein
LLAGTITEEDAKDMCGSWSALSEAGEVGHITRSHFAPYPAVLVLAYSANFISKRRGLAGVVEAGAIAVVVAT